MLDANSNNFDQVVQSYHNDSSLQRSSKQQELESLTILGYQVLDMMDDRVDNSVVMEYFMSQLTEEQQLQVANMLVVSAGLDPIDQTQYEQNRATSRGWHNTHLVLAMSVGYLSGVLASWALGAAITYFLATFSIILGPFALLIGTILGAILAGVIEYKLDEGIRNKGHIPGFRIVLFTIGVWWFWGSGDTDINILDFLFLVTGYIGGKMGRGKAPAPVWA